VKKVVVGRRNRPSARQAAGTEHRDEVLQAEIPLSQQSFGERQSAFGIHCAERFSMSFRRGNCAAAVVNHAAKKIGTHVRHVNGQHEHARRGNSSQSGNQCAERAGICDGIVESSALLPCRMWRRRDPYSGRVQRLEQVPLASPKRAALEG